MVSGHQGSHSYSQQWWVGASQVTTVVKRANYYTNSGNLEKAERLAQTFNPSTQETEVGRSLWMQGCTHLHCPFRAPEWDLVSKMKKKVCHDLVSKEWATGPACGFRSAVGAQAGGLQCATGNHSAFLSLFVQLPGVNRWGRERQRDRGGVFVCGGAVLHMPSYACGGQRTPLDRWWALPFPLVLEQGLSATLWTWETSPSF